MAGLVVPALTAVVLLALEDRLLGAAAREHLLLAGVAWFRHQHYKLS